MKSDWLAMAMAVPTMAVLFAWNSESAWASFPSVIVQAGNGPMQLHLPLAGFAVAGLIGWSYARRYRLDARRVSICAVLLFGAIHLLAVLGLAWQRGVYDTVLAARNGTSSYRLVADAYVVGLFAAGGSLCMWIIARARRGESPADAFGPLPHQRAAATTLLTAALLAVPLLSMVCVALRGRWSLLGVLVVCDAAAFWIGRRRGVVEWRRKHLAAIERVLAHDATIVALLMLVAFAIRWYWGRHVLALTGNLYPTASDDGPTYDNLARTIAAGRLPFSGDAFYWGGTLYWYALAAVYRVAGLGNFGAAILLQASLGALVPATAYAMGRLLLKSKVLATACGVICALHLVLITLSGVIGMEALYVPLACVALAGLLWLAGDARRPAAACVGVGAMFGLANLARMELFAYPVLLLIITGALAWRSRHRLADRRAADDFRLMALVCTGFFAVGVAQGVFNYVGYGEFRTFTGQARMVFPRASFGIHENEWLQAMGFNPFDDAARALHVLVNDPVTVGRLLVVGFAKRFRTFFLVPGFGVFDPLTLTSSNWMLDYYPSMRVSFSSLIETYELVLSAIGFGALLLSVSRMRRLVLAVLVGNLAFLYAVVDVKGARHRAVLVPFLVVAFVNGVAVALGYFRQRSSNADPAHRDIG